MTIKRLLNLFLSLAGIVLVLSIVSHLYVSYNKNAIKKQQMQAHNKSHFTPEEIKQDLDFFQDLMQRIHPAPIDSFPLNDIDSEMQALRSSVKAPLTRLDFYRQLAPVVTAIHDEHVELYPPENVLANHYKTKGRFFPFHVKFIDENLYISQNLSDTPAIKAGMQIISINDIPAQTLGTKLMAYYSGTNPGQKRFYLQTHFHEMLFLVYGFSDQFELELGSLASNSTLRVAVAGKPLARPRPEAFSFQSLGSKTLLFTYNAFSDEKDTFDQFLTQMFEMARQKNTQNLIIDLRNNKGGATALGDKLLSYLTADSFIQLTRSQLTISKELKANYIGYLPGFLRWLPIQYMHPLLKPIWTGDEGGTAMIHFEPITPKENGLRFTGDVYLLVGPGVMSSSSLLAATVQKYKIGTLVGEKTGGYATHYGCMIKLVLPNTGLVVTMPTSVNYGNSTGPIVPDHIVTQTRADLIKHQDTVLGYVLNRIQTNQ